MRTRCYLAWALVASILAGCGDNGPTVPLVVDVTNMPWWLEVGDSVQLEAVAREWDDIQGGPIGPPVQGVEFTWRSLAPSVVSVGASGLAVAHAKGVAELEVCVSGGSCMGWQMVVVNPVAGVVVTPDSVSVLPYGRYVFEAVPIDAEGVAVLDPYGEYWWLIADSITWTSADRSVAVMGSQGPEDYVSPSTMSGVAVGSTAITATFRGHSASATVNVVLVDFHAVVTGSGHSCALTIDDQPYCWGTAPQQQADPQTWYTPAFVPRVFSASPKLLTLSLGGGAPYPSGGGHSCGLAADGTAYCWGSNASGQLGQGTLQYYEQPVPAGRYTRIAVGGSHTCGLSSAGELLCWGSNANGQLGITSAETCGGGGGKYSTPEYPCTSAPTIVAGRPQFVEVSTGSSHTCGLTADGSAYCWGLIGSHDSADTLRVPGGHAFVAISSGPNHACGLEADGAAYCWGTGGLGYSDITMSSDEPVAVAGELRFLNLDGGVGLDAGTCGVATDNAVYCWGFPDWTFAGPTPTRVSGGIAFWTISAGMRHACGMGLDGLAYCWGESSGGVLGVPDTTGVLLTPRPVVGQQ